MNNITVPPNPPPPLHKKIKNKKIKIVAGSNWIELTDRKFTN